MKNIKKFLSVVLICSLGLCMFSGCSKFNKGNAATPTSREIDDSISGVVESFCEGVIKRDIDMIASVSNLSDEEIETVTDKLSYSDEFRKCIFERTTYEINYDSLITTSDGYGEVDLRFISPNYLDLIETNEFDNMEQLVAGLDSVGNLVQNVTIELSRSGNWHVTNTIDVIDLITYKFESIDFANLLYNEDYEIKWFGADDYSTNEAWYRNTPVVNLHFGYVDQDNIRYVITLDDKVLYTSELGEWECVYSKDNGAEVSSYGHIPTGDYVISFYYKDTLLTDCIAHVTDYGAYDRDVITYNWYDALNLDGLEGYYIDTTYIDVDIWDVEIMDNLYYTVTFEDKLLYTSDYGEWEGYWTESKGAKLDENGHLPGGIYYITFYVDDEEIDTCTAYVSNTAEGVIYEQE